MKIILASKSPRRREILSSLGIKFEVTVSDADETVTEKISGGEYACEVSRRKAEAVKALLKTQKTRQNSTKSSELNIETDDLSEYLIIASDTVVCCEEKILGKPKNKTEAREMIKLLSGKTHSVISGITVICGKKTISEYEQTEVSFRKLSNDEIEAYISTDEPYDKAGGYGIQDKAAIFVSGIKGDYLNVVGLPVFKLFEILKNEFGIGYFELIENKFE